MCGNYLLLMRFHLLALPNTQTTKAYSLDGFSQATIRFSRMLKEAGHHVTLYASEENEAPCDELVLTITKEEQATLLGATKYQDAAIDERWPLWQLSNARMVKEIAKRKEPADFICSLGGASQKPVADAHQDTMFVEYSIGYPGSFSPYRVFESHAWRHCTYGFQNIPDGRFYDTVIPVFFDPDEFHHTLKAEDFFLYVGRLIPRKGISIACEAAKAAGVPLKIIGHGDEKLITYGEYLGALSMEERNEWMSKAKAVFTPTQYIEPFCCVAVEAQMCGTPVISTDFGGFTETVEQHKTGFRCCLLREFIDAIKNIDILSRSYVHDRANRLYSMQAVMPQYERYFERLQTLHGDGWYSK